MAARKPDLRIRARALRKQGWALRRIANEVDAALSTVSLWVRDITATLTVTGKASDAGVTTDREVATVPGVRRCGRCHKDLPLTDFNRHPSGHQWWCRGCYREYFRARAKLHRRQVHVSRRNRREKARAFIADYLRTHACSDCCEEDLRVLEFHHLQEKRGNVTDMVRAGSSIQALQRELHNCIVLCANCHRVRTAASGGSWRLDPESLDRAAHLTPGERRNMAYIRELLLASKCVECCDSRIFVLDFDHVDTKVANVTDLARRGCSLRRLEAEASKCVVRCANCHRRRTLGSAAAMTG
jgi:hypothetical protein